MYPSRRACFFRAELSSAVTALPHPDDRVIERDRLDGLMPRSVAFWALEPKPVLWRFAHD